MPLRSLRRPRAVALAAAASSAALLALPASSALAGVPTALRATGLAEPAGTIVDPTGQTWVADGGGFCRLTDAAVPVLAQLDLATCLGGAPPLPALANAPGPAAPGQPAFQDPTPNAPNSGDEVVYVPDGASASHDLDVLQWDPATRTFSLKKTISLHNARSTSASVGPDGNVYVAFQASPTGDIERVSAPLSDTPSVDVVGHTDGASAVAAGYDAHRALTLYTAEATVMQLHPSAATQPTSTASPFDLGTIGNPAAPRAIGAVYYDLDDHVLYAGTGDAELLGTGIDVVDRFNTDSGLAELGYAAGFTLVSGLGPDPAGNLFVGNGVTGDQLMLARDTVAPATPVVVSPAGDATIAPSDAVTFASASDAALRWECGLDGGAFQPCASGAALPSLSDGRHTLMVRGTDRAGNISAASAPVAFTVKTPPTPAPADTKPAVAPIQLGGAPAAPRPAPRPAQRVFYRVAGRRALRVSALLTPGTRVLRVRLYRLNGAHGQRMVASVVRRTGTAAKYHMTLLVPAGLARGRYRLVVSAGGVATALRPLSSLVFSIRR